MMLAGATAQFPLASPNERRVRFFLCGDVMIGRGIDQILPQPCNPALHESYAETALDYVRLAETAHGSIPRRAVSSYPWGAALDEFDRTRPDVRIINLETSITRSEDYVHKGINYRISPENADCLAAAGIDCCVLANNHVLDWGRRGLLDTLQTLKRLKIKAAGAGANLGEAGAPAVFDIVGKARVLVFSFACGSSGTPHDWAATTKIPGVHLLPALSDETAARVADEIASLAQYGDLIVASIHWGSNWGYDISRAQRRFAHALIEKANVSIVHGHSSHHPKAIEVYRDRLILYGCGDFLNDYEGIGGYEEFRGDLVLMYFADLEPTGSLATVDVIPLQIRRFHLVRPSDQDVARMQQTLDRESRPFGVSVTAGSGGRLSLSWRRAKT
jgi:poly-gamma-glutamate capsule biosynthesis protein CapA/YwtB (metallophosphatase superfamily)